MKYVILGALQGVFEWLPVSSQAITVLSATFLGIENPIDLAIYLHLGTMLAVLVYFNWEILEYLKDRTTRNFLVLSTLISGIIGLPTYLFVRTISFNGSWLLLLVGLGLITTGFMLMKKKSGFKHKKDLGILDSLYIGALQGLTIIPGLSRSGTTMFGFLSRSFSAYDALKLSFIMSLPVVLAANIFIKSYTLVFEPSYLAALAASFVAGVISIHFLLGIARKVNFAWFCWFFGLLSVLSFCLATW